MDRVEGIKVVTVATVRLLDRKELDPLKGGDAAAELILLTMLPMPIQKAMVSPVNRPAMAPYPDTVTNTNLHIHPQSSCSKSQQPSSNHMHIREPGNSLTRGLAHGKNIPRQKSPSSGPPTMPKILSAAWS